MYGLVLSIWACNTLRMERRTSAATVADSVAQAMERNRVAASTLSEATGIPIRDLQAHLDGQSEFTFAELVAVGGFFHVHPSTFFEAVAA